MEFGETNSKKESVKSKQDKFSRTNSFLIGRVGSFLVRSAILTKTTVC